MLEEEVIFARFCTGVLYECLTQDKAELLTTYLSIYHTVRNMPRASDSISVANLQLVLTYYEHGAKLHTKLRAEAGAAVDSAPIVQSEFLLAVKLRLDAFFDSLRFHHTKVEGDDATKATTLPTKKEETMYLLQEYYFLQSGASAASVNTRSMASSGGGLCGTTSESEDADEVVSGNNNNEEEEEEEEEEYMHRGPFPSLKSLETLSNRLAAGAVHNNQGNSNNTGGGGVLFMPSQLRLLFGCYLRFYQLPSPDEFPRLRVASLSRPLSVPDLFDQLPDLTPDAALKMARLHW
jgi:hypothetical protein